MTPTRRLAAIMATDVVDFSALTHRDEESALRLVEEQRKIVRASLSEFEGREVKTIGDGFLIEFGSALNATKCAIEIQRRLEERNSVSETERVQVRIGLHVGDVVEDGDDILGDAVNIAARIEPLAEANGICVSGAIREQVHNKIPYSFVPLEHSFLKNIETPIEIYSIDLPWHGPPAARITPWTNREVELADLRSVLSSATTGKGSIVAISGEPGVGKTRLAEELIRLSKGRGFRTLRSRGYQGEPSSPYGHWAEAIRAYVREAPDPLLYKVCTACQSQVVKLVPELADRIGPGQPSPQLDPGPEQLRLFEGIAQFLRNVLKESPLILLLDDVHWADASTIAALDYLSREVDAVRLIIVLTYRDVEGSENAHLTELLSTLRRHHSLTELSLRRFDAQHATELVTAVLGDSHWVPNVADAVIRRAGGNPLFVEELVRALVEQRDLVRTPSGWSIGSGSSVGLPARIQDVILQRVNRFDDATQELLSIAAVLPDRFDLETLAEVGGSEAEASLRFVERMLRARIFREFEISPGVAVYQFVDDQTRETLYDRIAIPRRQQYHLRVAQALARADSSGSSAAVPDLAYHYYRGRDFPNAVRYSELAGDQSASVYAREAAIAHYRTALEALSHVPDDRTRFDILDRLGSELLATGRLTECFEAWKEAARGFERLEDWIRAGSLFLRLAEHRPESEEAAASRDYLRAQRNLEGSAPSRDLARFYLDQASIAQWVNDQERGRKFLDLAVRTAALVQDHALEAEIHIALGRAARSLSEGRAEIEEALKIALVHDPIAAIRMYWELASQLAMGSGELHESYKLVERGIALAEKLHYDDLVMDLIGTPRAYMAYWLGDLAVCARCATLSLEHRRRLGRIPSGSSACCGWAAAIARGDLEEGKKWEAILLTTGWADTGFGDFWRSYLQGCHHMAEGDFEAATERFDHSIVSIRGNLWSWSKFLPKLSISNLVECSIHRGRLEDANQYLTDLRALSSPSDSPAANAFLARAEGLLKLARGDTKGAIETLRVSIEEWVRSGMKIDEGKARMALARALTTLGNRAEALQEVRRAEALFERAGALPNLGEARSLQAALSGTS